MVSGRYCLLKRLRQDCTKTIRGRGREGERTAASPTPRASLLASATTRRPRASHTPTPAPAPHTPPTLAPAAATPWLPVGRLQRCLHTLHLITWVVRDWWWQRPAAPPPPPPPQAGARCDTPPPASTSVVPRSFCSTSRPSWMNPRSAQWVCACVCVWFGGGAQGSRVGRCRVRRAGTQARLPLKRRRPAHPAAHPPPHPTPRPPIRLLGLSGRMTPPSISTRAGTIAEPSEMRQPHPGTH